MAAGKDGVAYLLDGAHLGGIGGEQASMPRACSQEIDGGAAIVGTTVYLPCLSGPVAVQVSSNPAGLRLLWRATSGGGPPIVAAGLVWSIGQDGILYGLSATTGAVVEQASIGAPANHFPTPSVGGGVLLAAAATDVVAFHVATNERGGGDHDELGAGNQHDSKCGELQASGIAGGIPAGVIVAIALGGLAVAAGAAWFWRRARRRGVAS